MNHGPKTRPSSGLTEEDLVPPPRDFFEDSDVHINRNEGIPMWLAGIIGAIIIAELTWFGFEAVSNGRELVRQQEQINGIDRRVTRLEDR